MTKVIAFYLPQFHPIPENDEWWGEGFTEWTNVAKTKPRFRGHHQPQIPSDLGFYDLRLHETRVAQAELAMEHGIGGFCYYHYWFNGKMLLERPFNDVLSSKEPNLPFCLCWANENWTRRWDGLEQRVLIEQEYDTYDPIQHIKWLSNAFMDERYIKIDGKPIFLVYRTDSIPNIQKIICTWRNYTEKVGLTGIYLCAVNGAGNKSSHKEMINKGFDAIIDFQPNTSFMGKNRYLGLFRSPKQILPNLINQLVIRLNLQDFFPKLETYRFHDYNFYVEQALLRPKNKEKVFPCIFPSWDNSARRKVDAGIIQNDDPEPFAKWLEDSISRVKEYPYEEQIIFINAWNEWAEGCHLEPDLRNGLSFLKKIDEVIREALAASHGV
jgi:Glycosyltransferase WbsX